MATVSSLVGKPPATRTSRAIKDTAARQKKAQRSAVLLKQMSDPTRLQVVALLADGERHVGALCADLNQSQPAVSHHLALLRHGGIITPRRQGKNNFYALTETGEKLAHVVRGLVK